MAEAILAIGPERFIRVRCFSTAWHLGTSDAVGETKKEKRYKMPTVAFTPDSLPPCPWYGVLVTLREIRPIDKAGVVVVQYSRTVDTV